MRTVQKQHAEWLRRLYPGQVAKFPAAGMVEEAGELMHVLLKCQQANGGEHPEQRYHGSDWNTKFVDAVGDCGIYVCSLCNTVGWDFEELLSDAKRLVSKEKSVFDAAAQLVFWGAATCLNITRPSVLCYAAQLAGICDTWGFSLEACVRQTWNIVRERK